MGQREVLDLQRETWTQLRGPHGALGLQRVDRARLRGLLEALGLGRRDSLLGWTRLAGKDMDGRWHGPPGL